MGIRTVGFKKASHPITKEEKPPEEKTSKEESTTTTPPKEENVVDTKDNEVVDENVSLKPATFTGVAAKSSVTVKVRTPTSMARLGGLKAVARKLKKNRKRRLFARPGSATKILIKSSKPRRPVKMEDNSWENRSVAPSRVTTRMCVRRSSREGIMEAPLRTVELIKRPLELREPATKLLYMASLGLYPDTGDSDGTPIVVVKELVTGSPGKKNGVKKSLELPLIPQFFRRVTDLANAEKRSMAENIKPSAAKEPKREVRKTSPVTNSGKQEKQEKPETLISPKQMQIIPPITIAQTTISESSERNQTSSVAPKSNFSKANISIELKRKSPVNGVGRPLEKSMDLTITAAKPPITAVPVSSPPFMQEVGKVQASSKSLLRNDISPPSMPPGIDLSFSSALGLLQNSTSKKKRATQKQIPVTPTFDVSSAMNLMMSSITILPAVTATNLTSRKRPSNSILSDTKVMEAETSGTTIGNYPKLVQGKPPRKKQKNSTFDMKSRLSLPSSITVNNVNASTVTHSQNNSFVQQLPPPQNLDEALNLCVKRGSEPPVAAVNLSPPKLQNKSNLMNDAKGSLNGSRCLNLIIPRPPPLTKAPLEQVNITNANIVNYSQNVQPVESIVVRPQIKKPKKSRPSHNQRNQSSMQLPILPQLTSHAVSPDATAHSKSLLKCMNGEENAVVRGIGGTVETLDSVKTMLARLQTSIGPAVNGVRLITIE